MLLDQTTQTFLYFGVQRDKGLRIDELRMILALGDEAAVDVVDPRDAARHSGSEVHPGVAEYDNRAARHVLAAVIANAFNHRCSARVAYSEALACASRR